MHLNYMYYRVLDLVIDGETPNSGFCWVQLWVF